MLKRAIAFLLLLASLAAPAAAQTYTVTSIAAEDAEIRENTTTWNCPACTTVMVRSHATGDYRALYRFDLPALPAGSRVVSATLRLYVTSASSSAVTVHRATQAWSEAAVTWGNSNGVAHDATAAASFVPSTAARYYDIDVLSVVSAWRSGTANYGFVVRTAGNNHSATFTSREATNALTRPQLVLVVDPPPALTTVLSSPVTSDPHNGTTNPKAVPGAAILYSLNVVNSSSGYPDANAVVVVQPVPARTSLFVGNLNGTSGGPVRFVQGTPASGLTYTYASLSSTADDISFSSNGGSTYGYTPVPDASGYDAAVTHVRINPKGTLAGASAAGSPGFTLSFRVKVK